MKDVPDMYFKHEWKPYCFQKTPHIKSWAKMFAVPMSAEDIECEKYLNQEYIRMADALAALKEDK